MTQVRKKVAMVCPTFRAEGKNNTARFMGAMALVDQVLNQTSEHDIYLAVVDDSKEAHPFLQRMAEAHPEKIIYMHIPNKNEVSAVYKADFREAVNLIPTDEAIKNTPFWKKRMEQMEGWAKIVPFEDSFAAKIDIRTHIHIDRPTIGTKRNVGIMAIYEKFGEPDYVVAADDDDYRSSTYVAEITASLDQHDFTRIGRYLTYMSYPGEGEVWGEYDLQLQQDANGHFYPSDSDFEKPLLTSQKEDDGTFVQIDMKTWWSRLAIGAWDPICNEGAIHNWRFSTWKKGFQEFGGYAPTNMGDDIILYRELTETFGKSVTRGMVPFQGHNFVRVADGTNASSILFTNTQLDGALPKWAESYIDDLKAAREFRGDYRADSVKIADDMVKTGQYRPRKVFV